MLLTIKDIEQHLEEYKLNLEEESLLWTEGIWTEGDWTGGDWTEGDYDLLEAICNSHPELGSDTREGQNEDLSYHIGLSPKVLSEHYPTSEIIGPNKVKAQKGQAPIEPKQKKTGDTLLEELLKTEYQQERISPQCQNQTIEFIKSHESVLGRDIEFIKGLTKAAYKIHKKDPNLLEGSLEKIYQFNLEGIETIHSGKTKGMNHIRIVKLKSHFYSHKGYFAEVILNSLKEKGAHPEEIIQWAKKWYRSYIISATINEQNENRNVNNPQFEFKHITYCYSFAAEGAKAVFNYIDRFENIPKREKIQWARRWAEAKKTSAYKSMGFNQKHAAHSFMSAAEARRKLFYKTNEMNYATGAIDFYGRFLDFYRANPRLITPGIQKMIKNTKSKVYNLNMTLTA